QLGCLELVVMCAGQDLEARHLARDAVVRSTQRLHGPRVLTQHVDEDVGVEELQRRSSLRRFSFMSPLRIARVYSSPVNVRSLQAPAAARIAARRSSGVLPRFAGEGYRARIARRMSSEREAPVRLASASSRSMSSSLRCICVRTMCGW